MSKITFTHLFLELFHNDGMFSVSVRTAESIAIFKNVFRQHQAQYRLISILNIYISIAPQHCCPFVALVNYIVMPLLSVAQSATEELNHSEP